MTEPAHDIRSAILSVTDFEALAAERPKGSDYGDEIRKWIKANAERRVFNAVKLADGTLELSMLDIIGEDYWSGGGITSNKVKAQIDAHKDVKTIKVLMNTPGGDAYEGLAIQSILKRTGARIEIEVVGLCASAGTVIAMAGDSIQIHEGALFMIHPAWTFAMGNKSDLRKTADFLDKVDGGILDIYARRTGRPKDEITPLFEATTWMTAHEAVAEKFATEVIAAKSGGDNKEKAKAMAENNQPAAGSNPDPSAPRAVNASAELVEVAPGAVVNGTPITDEERATAADAARLAAAKAVEDRRSEERREFMDTHPLARAGKEPAPPFGGMRAR